MDKNKNKKYCQDWEGVTNFAIAFPGWNTALYMLQGRIGDAATHVYRFTRSLNSGVVSFIGSSDAEVEVKTIEENGVHYIEAHYIVYNSTSLKSYRLHLIPDSENSKIWKQEYHWYEKYFCCDKNATYESLMNTFPYNLYGTDVSCPAYPFGGM